MDDDTLHMGNQPQQSYEPPIGEIEQELSTIWSRVLKIKKVSRNDNFFELGGNSLQATEITYNIHDTFGIELPIRTLFEEKTIKALAEKIDSIYNEVLGEEMDEGIIV